MTMTHQTDLTPPTPFTDRCDTLRTAFSPIAWSPDASADMAKADQAVASALQDLVDQFADPDPETLRDAGAKFAAGKGVSAVRKVLEAPSTDSPRFRAVYAAAKAELVRRHDLPEFSVATLIEQGAAVLADVLPAMARDAVDSLEHLPADVQDGLRAGRLRADQLDGLEQGRPLDAISAIRAASAAWAPWYALAGGGLQGRDMWRNMYAAVASGNLSPNRTMDLADGVTGAWAVVLDTPAMVAIGAGLNPVEVILSDQGTMEPLWDPFNTQAEVYAHRVRAAGAAHATMMTMTDKAAANIYNGDPLMNRRAAQRRSESLPLHRRVGLTKEQAVDAALEAHPEYAQDPGELVPATDD